MIKLELLFLVVASHALNLGHKQTQTYYNATNYLSDLEARQAQFKTDINLIKSQIDQINKVLNSSTLTPNQQLRTLSEGTADERDSLYNIETYLNMPFETEPCKPCNLTTQQKQSLQKQVDVVKQSLVNLESQVDFCPECPQIQQIQLEVQKEKNYIKVIEATLNSGCLQRPYEFIPEDPSGLVNLANSLYKDNLKATNWIYGNITEADYRLYLFSLSTQYNLTSCPLATPYVDSTSKRCYACAGTYSVGQKKCYPCPSDQHYNSSTSKCEQNPKICPNGTTLNTQTNNCEAITCPEGQKYDNTTLKCISICSQTEYYNVTTKKCQIIPVTCQPGTRYNSTSGKCQAIVCSAGQVFNSTSNKCQPIVCPIGQTFNLTTLKCEAIVCPAGQIFDFVNARCIDKVNNTLGLCPPDKPFWNSVTIRCEVCPNTYPIYNAQLNRCQSCPNGQVWNITLKKCQIGCPSGQTLNPTTGKCSPVCPADKPLNPLTNNCQTQCPNGTTLNKDTNVCEIVCSSGTILNKTTNKCEIQCPSGQVLNRDTNQCQIVCQTGYKYNSTSKNCQVECPAGLIYNVVNKKCQAQCKANSQWDGNLGGCVCNIGYYSNGTDCLLLVLDRNCSLATPIWNQTTKKCQTCPIDKPNYSPSLKQCLAPCPAGYIWSNITYNCQMQKCPDAKPILNFTSGQCQSCPPLTEWSSTQKICIKSQINYTCPEGYIFNTTLKKCQIMYCPDGYHLNRNTYQCQKCSEGAYYNATAQQCYKCPNGTNYDASKGYCQMISCSAGQYASAKLNKCVSIPSCGTNQYFSVQNQSCVLIPNCGLNQVFNLSSLKCQLSSSSGGCSSGYFFNTTISQCQPYNYLTSPTSPNLIYTFPFQNYIDQYKVRRESDPASQDCPSATPYYDQKNKYCVSCSKDFPYFNLHTNLCQNCGSEGFDQSLRRCKAQSMNLGPTLQRLIMNIL